MRHSHVSGESHKISENKTLLLEHADDVTEEGRCDCGPMRRGDFQPNREIWGRGHRWLEVVQVSVVAAVPVGRKLAGGPLEYQEGASSLGPFRQVTTEGGGGSFNNRICFGKWCRHCYFLGMRTRSLQC